jgi:pyruvate/2-oxoglutarate dehydrogenase complex dihydrolipoamide dehydrogenase (E3) component
MRENRKEAFMAAYDYDLGILGGGAAGLTAAAGAEYRTLEAAFRDVDRALAEGETEGTIKVLISPSGALLGCQIAGHHAGELIHEWVAAINGGVKLSTMAGAIHAYPTLAEISKKAAGSYYSEKLFGDRTKKILRFLFDLKGRACTPEEEVSG